MSATGTAHYTGGEEMGRGAEGRILMAPQILISKGEQLNVLSSKMWPFDLGGEDNFGTSRVKIIIKTGGLKWKENSIYTIASSCIKQEIL